MLLTTRSDGMGHSIVFHCVISYPLVVDLTSLALCLLCLFRVCKNPLTKSGFRKKYSVTRRTCVRAKGLEPLRRLRHWNLNPARLPIPPRPLIRCDGPRNKLSPFTTNYLIAYYEASRPKSRRSLSTWPLALTLYCATSTLPCSSTTMVERISPS